MSCEVGQIHGVSTIEYVTKSFFASKAQLREWRQRALALQV